MKYAFINGIKSEATKGMMAQCPLCDAELVAKCGEVKVNHWAHRGRRTCDIWWENETEWHRDWKCEFPVEWQEVVHRSEAGERHIADVKALSGWVIEFQHSYLDPIERRARNAFYGKLIWVVDGSRRTRDLQQFQKILEDSTPVFNSIDIRRIRFPDESRLITEWRGGGRLVFFDFLDTNSEEKYDLWCMLPTPIHSSVYLLRCSRRWFVESHLSDKFDVFYAEMVVPLIKRIATNQRSQFAFGLRTEMTNAQRRRRRNRL